MKLDTNVFQGKPPSLEEGPMKYEPINEYSNYRRSEKSNGWSRCMHSMKVILYLELILFIGWIGCISFTYYYKENSVDRSYEVSEWPQEHYSQSAVSNSDSMPAEEIEWSPRDDDTKVATEKNEPPTILVIEEKNDYIKIETTTSPSLIVTNDPEMEESMLLSRWLQTLKHPRNNWDDSSSKFNLLWSSILTSVEEKSAKSTEDSNDASMANNYFGTMENKEIEENDEFRDFEINDSSALPSWQDSLWFSEAPDEITPSENDLFQDDHFENFHFEFRFPELVDRILSAHARTTIDEDESFSSQSSEKLQGLLLKAKRSTDSSSSEETNGPVSKVKRSTDSSSSSSSEETNGPVARAKRSTESSSSEEKNNPIPKLKRSADSSSSESDSSDSSSSENDGTTPKAIKVGTSCPKILDDDGSTIDDPEDIVNHIKRNWFNWLLETPVPDCDGPKSAKTVTIDECGKFVVRCTTDESNDTSEKSKESVTDNRYTRSVEVNDVALQKCDRMVNEFRESLDNLIMGFVAGELTDKTANKLRRDFMKAVMSLTIRVIVEQSTDGRNTTDRQWNNLLLEIRQNISNSVDAEHRQRLEENGLPTKEMANELRDSVEAMANVYMNCHDMLVTSKETRKGIRILRVMIEREKCLMLYEKMQTRENSLAAEIVPGDSLDSIVIGLRQRFRRLLRPSAIVIGYNETHDLKGIPIGPLNVTDEQWRTFMLEIKQEIVNATEDPVIRQRLEASGPPTQEQTNEFHAIVEYYMREYRQCSTMNLFGFLGALKAAAREEGNRRKRWVMADPEVVVDPVVVKCTFEEDDVKLIEERQARLKDWNKEVAAGGPYSQETKSLLDTIQAEINTENPSVIPVRSIKSEYREIVSVANYIVANSSSNLRRVGYELARDVILECRKLKNNDSSWEGYDMNILAENFTDSLLFHASDNLTPEFVFLSIIEAGKAVNLRYSGLGDGKKCEDPCSPAYGNFTYIGEEPEKPGVRNWRHILSGVVKLWFRVRDPSVLPGLRCTESQTGESKIEGSKDVVKRSIGYPTRGSDNSVRMDDKFFENRDDFGSLRRANFDVEPEPRNLQMSQKMFVNKMETLSSHIDRLHDLYQRFNELSDDYVSRELPDELEVHYGY